MKRNPFVIVLLALCGLAAALYIGRFAAAGASIYISLLSPRVLMIFGGWTKLLALLIAATFAFRSAIALGRSNPAHAGWMTLASGLAFYSLGQATLVMYQTATGVSPFPSLADLWFMIAYPLLIAALGMVIAAYVRSGFPARGFVPAGVMTLLAGIAVAWILVLPIARMAAPRLEKFLNAAYPLLDLMLLVPAVVLLTITIRFRGGAIWRLWAALLSGIIFTILGDIGFAWFSTLGYQSIDPLVHAMYILGYGSIALGTSIQYQLVAPAPSAEAQLLHA